MEILIDKILFQISRFILPSWEAWAMVSYGLIILVALTNIILGRKKLSDPKYFRKILLYGYISALPTGFVFGVIWVDLLNPGTFQNKTNILLSNLFLWPLVIVVVYMLALKSKKPWLEKYRAEYNEENSEINSNN